MPEDTSAPSTSSTSDGADGTAGTAAERVQEMRGRLGAQREAEDLLTEASNLRRSAAERADAIVAEAEGLAAQLVAEAHAAADTVATEAKERADGILARAYREADDLQRHTEEERARIRAEVVAASRAEMDDLRARSVQVLTGAQEGLAGLAPGLEDAIASVSRALRSLDELRDDRSGTGVAALGTVGPDAEADPEPDPQAEADADPTSASLARRAADEPTAASEAATPVTSRPSGGSATDPEARPLGWLFRASQA